MKRILGWPSGLLLVMPLVIGTLGVLVMRRHDASASQVALHVAALVVGTLLSVALAALGKERLLACAPRAAGFTLALLGATLFGQGFLGVRRWLVLGPVRFHASSIASPVLLVGVAALLSGGRWGWASLLLAAAQVCHALQPDAGQALALAAGSLALFASQAAPPRVRTVSAAAIAASVVPALVRADPLPAVPIVEGIVGLAGNLGRPFQALSIVNQALLPVALALTIRGAPVREPFAQAAGWGLVGYVAAILLVPIWGNFPVAVMGFGVSPVLGVAICAGVAAALGRSSSPAP